MLIDCFRGLFCGAFRSCLPPNPVLLLKHKHLTDFLAKADWPSFRERSPFKHPWKAFSLWREHLVNPHNFVSLDANWFLSLMGLQKLAKISSCLWHIQVCKWKDISSWFSLSGDLGFVYIIPVSYCRVEVEYSHF